MSGDPVGDSRDGRGGGLTDPAPPPESSEFDYSARGRFRPRDSMGALRPTQAEVDAAFARGYAQGQEEAQEDALDQLRTILERTLEAQFGPIDEPHLDWIGGATFKSLSRAIISAHRFESPDDLLAL